MSRSGSPFLNGKRIHPKMNECSQFLALPAELAGSRHDGGRFPDDVGLAVRPVDNHILRCETVLCLSPGWLRRQQTGSGEARPQYNHPKHHTPESVHHFTVISSLTIHAGAPARLCHTGQRTSQRFRYARSLLIAPV